MRACYIDEYGTTADVIKTGIINDPTPSSGEVIIQVKSASLNHLDIWVRLGRPGKSIQFPHILGSDASGIIAKTGAGVKGIEVGEEVIINPGLSCGKCDYCERGEESECSSFGIIGLSRNGTYAGLISVPATNIRKKPAHLSFDEAAAIPLSYLTAWRMLITKGKMTKDSTVLIHGIGGGVAQSALKIASTFGAKTIVTSSSQQKLDSAMVSGATHTISYKEQNVAKAVKEFTNGKGVDIIIDTTGAKTMAINTESAKKGGKIIVCGITTGANAEINLHSIYWNQLEIIGSTMGSNNDFNEMINFVSDKKIKPVIDSVYQLDQIKEAVTRMEQGKQYGKIILSVS